MSYIISVEGDMMKINFIDLVNFRNIQRQYIDFEDKNFIVLIGDNGSGKTSILEAITKAFVPVLRVVNSEAMKKCDLTNDDIHSGEKSTVVKLGITLDGEEYVWENRRRLDTFTPFASIIDSQKKKGIKELKSKYATCVEKEMMPLVLYYGTDRIIRDMPKRAHIKNFKVTDSLRYCFDNVNYFRDFYDWFKTEEDIELRKQREDVHYVNEKLECVRRAIENMISGYSHLRIKASPSRMVMTNSEGVDLCIDQLSGGYKAVLSVVADIAKRMSIAYPYSSNPLNEEVVILIDELDLHLHPKWQKQIVNDLKRTFPNCQFIVSTHSPFIIQSLNQDELFDMETMSYGQGNGNYKGWSIDEIQQKKMGVETKTDIFNECLKEFSVAMDEENYECARGLYIELKKMVNADSAESRMLDLDMEMMKAND